MGRSVETIGNNVIYFDFSYDVENDYPDLAEEDWNDLCDNIEYAVKDKYPSMLTLQRKWVPYPYQENRILLENDHIQISISEYCGCGAVSIFVRPDAEYPELAGHWLCQVWDGLSQRIGEYISVISRIGTMSNGVSVFRKAE